MSYRLEGKDLVISGFETGIANDPYNGIAEMRNIDITTVPGEAAVAFSMQNVTEPPAFNAVAYTAQATGNTITIADTTGLYIGCAIFLDGNTATGLTDDTVYYVFNITPTTFQVRLAAVNGSAIDITSDGTGTLTTYQYGNQRGVFSIAPVSYFVDGSGAGLGVNSVYLVDGSNYAWSIPLRDTTVPANSMIFLGNIGGIGASMVAGNGVAIWNSHIILLGAIAGTMDIADIGDVMFDGPAASWDYGWEAPGNTSSVNGRISTLVSYEDGNLYWTTQEGLGSLIETPGETFDPTDDTTYTITDAAIALPEPDTSTCIAELGSSLLIGGEGSFVYVWDKVSLGFNTLLNIPDAFTTHIVATSQNAYVFSGNRGRIYITNGSGIDLYKKIPDYVTGTTRPYIVWGGADFGRNQLYFSFAAYSNADVKQDTVSGVWAIDLETDALRLMNKQVESGYGGIVPMVVNLPANTRTDNPSGYGVMMGWYSGSTYSVCLGSSNPYTSFESYLQTDMIPAGTYLDPFSPSQIEWKTSVPLGGNGTAETIRLSYRTNLNEAFTLLGTTTATGTTVVGTKTGTTTGTYAVSDYYQANFQKVQWVQFLVEMSSNTTTPTYCRLTEIRVRDWPSGKNAT